MRGWKSYQDGDRYCAGPIGASWHKNGPGNVDHILWIAMKKDGPEIAMITLDGIWDRKGRDLKLKEVYERTAETEGIFKEAVRLEEVGIELRYEGCVNWQSNLSCLREADEV